jgi:two-component system response regulator
MKINKKISILVADGDQDDVYLLNELFEQYELINPIHFVPNGVELLEFLQREGKFRNVKKSPRPDLILLDLNMPKMDGIVALESIKSNHLLEDIPIVVMTSSKTETDIARSLEYDVDGYIQKPILFKSFSKVIELLSDKGISIVD